MCYRSVVIAITKAEQVEARAVHAEATARDASAKQDSTLQHATQREQDLHEQLRQRTAELETAQSALALASSREQELQSKLDPAASVSHQPDPEASLEATARIAALESTAQELQQREQAATSVLERMHAALDSLVRVSRARVLDEETPADIKLEAITEIVVELQQHAVESKTATAASNAKIAGECAVASCGFCSLRRGLLLCV